MVPAKTSTGVTTVNQSKVMKNHDEWHDVPLQAGLQEPLVVELPELDDVEQPSDTAQFVFFTEPEQGFFMEIG